MKKYFVTSDVHGFYDELMLALSSAGWEQDNPNHIFISCGDLLDRGTQPRQCLQFVNNLPENRKLLVLGNHEVLLQEAINRGGFYSHDWSNGTGNTVYYLNNVFEGIITQSKSFTYLLNVKEDEDWIKYMDSICGPFCLLFDDKQKYVFTHGWLPKTLTGEGSWNKLLELTKNLDSLYEHDWDNSIWDNGMKEWSRGNIVDQDATVVCGHFHTSWGHAYLHDYGTEFDDNEVEKTAHFEPFIDKGIVAIDSCCAYSGKLNVYVIEVEE